MITTIFGATSSAPNLALIIAIVVGVILLLILVKSVKIVQEYERAVIFRLGRCIGAKGPGIFFIIPVVDKMRKVNLQMIAAPVPPQQVITKDNVTVLVDAVAYFQVVDAAASIVKVQDWYTASQLIAQTTLRSTIGRHELDQLLAERDRLDAELQVALDTQTESWGISVRRVEIRDVQLPEQMQRAMARQAEAERERRAKVIAAEGEFEASLKLSQAAAAMAATPGAMHLRTLQTMAEIATEKNSTIIFPIPTEIMSALNSVTARATPTGEVPIISPSFVPQATPPEATPPKATPPEATPPQAAASE